MFDEVMKRLTPAVKAYAEIGYAYTVNKHIEVFFVQNSTEEEYVLKFDNLSHLELWAQSCQRAVDEENPDLIPYLFAKRLVK